MAEFIAIFEHCVVSRSDGPNFNERTVLIRSHIETNVRKMTVGARFKGDVPGDALGETILPDGTVQQRSSDAALTFHLQYINKIFKKM